MSFHPMPAFSGFRPLRFLLASALTGLVASAAACSSDSKDDPAKGGTSASGGGGTASNNAGKSANDAGKASGAGGTVSEGAGGDTPSGGAPDDGSGAAAGAPSDGGSSSGTGGSSSAGSGNGVGTLPGNDVWNCIAAGTTCICQNNGDPSNANTCTGTYECCFAGPFANGTRCQCQDPNTSTCSDLASVFGPSGRVVDHCPP